MGEKPDIDVVYRVLKKHFIKYRMPIVDLIEQQTKDPFKILLATILSARTKDQTTAAASRRLFEKVNTLEDLNNLSLAEIGECIFPVGFWKNKAQYLKQLPAVLESRFNGIVPDTVEELIQLPGVGRKTANLVVAVGFHKPAVCVDIHVHRISNRLGYVNTKDPFHTEMALRKKLPKKYWITINSYLVSFGQNLCTPINPKCNTCPIFDQCRAVGVTSKYR